MCGMGFGLMFKPTFRMVWSWILEGLVYYIWEQPIYYIKETYDYIVSIPFRIGRIISYIPVIWNDHDWDHAYVLKLLRYKFKRMRNLFQKCTHHDHIEDIVYLTYTIEVLDRLIKDDYYLYSYPKCFEEEDKDWERLMLILDENMREWWC